MTISCLIGNCPFGKYNIRARLPVLGLRRLRPGGAAAQWMAEVRWGVPGLHVPQRAAPTSKPKTRQTQKPTPSRDFLQGQTMTCPVGFACLYNMANQCTVIYFTLLSFLVFFFSYNSSHNTFNKKQLQWNGKFHFRYFEKHRNQILFSDYKLACH